MEFLGQILNKMKRQILIKHKFVLFFIHVLNNNVMHHTIYRNKNSVLKTSAKALYDLTCLKALVIDLSTTDPTYQDFKILA